MGAGRQGRAGEPSAEGGRGQGGGTPGQAGHWDPCPNLCAGARPLRGRAGARESTRAPAARTRPVLSSLGLEPLSRAVPPQNQACFPAAGSPTASERRGGPGAAPRRRWTAPRAHAAGQLTAMPLNSRSNSTSCSQALEAGPRRSSWLQPRGGRGGGGVPPKGRAHRAASGTGPPTPKSHVIRRPNPTCHETTAWTLVPARALALRGDPAPVPALLLKGTRTHTPEPTAPGQGCFVEIPYLFLKFQVSLIFHAATVKGFVSTVRSSHSGATSEAGLNLEVAGRRQEVAAPQPPTTSALA